MIGEQISKTAGHYRFIELSLEALEGVPLLSASFINSIRRDLAEKLEALPCGKKDLLLRNIEVYDKDGNEISQKKTSYKNNISNRLSEAVYRSCGAESIEPAYEISHASDAELMRTKYCLRYELGMCPKHHGCKNTGHLYLLNNGQKFVLSFDCRNCEMTLSEA